MAGRRGGLGKGLDSLIPVSEEKTSTKKSSTTTKSTSKSNIDNKPKSNVSSAEQGTKETFVKISLVEPDKNQPRKEFDENALQELADSIKKYGIIQPLIVKKSGKFYQLIAGERRWRAAKIAGLKEVPVIVRDYSDIETVEVSIIENIQRENLNPIEESLGYQRLIDEFHLTQEDIAHRVSKSRVSITNSLRLLKLNGEVQQMVINGDIATGHAKVLLGIENKDAQLQAARVIADKKMSVRETEKYVSSLNKPSIPVKPTIKHDDTYDVFYRDMEEKMKEAIGSKVTINQKNGKKGKIEIEYYSQADLEVIYNTILSIRR